LKQIEKSNIFGIFGEGITVSFGEKRLNEKLRFVDIIFTTRKDDK
jgi:hypothetical protein